MTGIATTQMAVARTLQPGVCLTTAELAERSGVPRNQVTNVCTRLLYRGWIERREIGCFVLSETGAAALASGEVPTAGPIGPTATRIPRTKSRQSGRDRIWRAIRIKRKFSIPEIEEAAEASRANTARYVSALYHAGYLRQLRREPATQPGRRGNHRWLLVEDPGPGTPAVLARGTLFDPNSGTHRVLGGRRK